MEREVEGQCGKKEKKKTGGTVKTQQEEKREQRKNNSHPKEGEKEQKVFVVFHGHTLLRWTH